MISGAKIRRKSEHAKEMAENTLPNHEMTCKMRYFHVIHKQFDAREVRYWLPARTLLQLIVLLSDMDVIVMLCFPPRVLTI